VRQTNPKPSLLAYLHINSKEKGLEHGENHHNQPPQDLPDNEATLGICSPKPHTLRSDDEDGGSARRVVNRQTIDDEAGHQAHDGQHACQLDRNGLSSQWLEVSKTEAAVTKMATKGLEEKEHALGLSAPLSFDLADPAEIPRGVSLIKAISPLDEDWVLVDDDNNPVSQIALSDCQHKLRNDSQSPPRLGRTSSGAAVGKQQSRPSLLYIKVFALAGLLTGCPNTIAQAHRAQHPSLSSKHVGSGGKHPGETEPCQVGVVFTFASQTLTRPVLS